MSMTFWRKAGFTYSHYVAIAGKTLRLALKPEYQTAAVINRGKTEALFVKLKNGVPEKDPQPLQE